MLGLPYTSALAMAGTGLDRGPHAAVQMATAGLLGLVASVALPLGFLRAVGRGWGAASAGALGIGCYALIAVMSGVTGLFGWRPGPLLLLSLGAVLLASRLARSGPEPGKKGDRGSGISPGRAMILRTLVPAACLSVVLAVRESAGPGWAGLIAPFPGLTLTILVITYLEAGPEEACRMARVVPAGNLGMIAFFGACGAITPGWGLIPAMLIGYASAIAGLLAVERLTRWPARQPWNAQPTTHPPWSRPQPVRFLPHFEVVA